MVARGVTLALVAIDETFGHTIGKRRGTQNKINPQSLVAGEPQLFVIPVRETFGLQRANHIGHGNRRKFGETGALDGADVGGYARNHAGVATVLVKRGNIEVAHERQLQGVVRRQLRPDVVL
ncbi:MAG: hypothetical protein RIS25_1171 [Actinomycetota bacterium]